jgi:hypothetical protein
VEGSEEDPQQDGVTIFSASARWPQVTLAHPARCAGAHSAGSARRTHLIKSGLGLHHFYTVHALPRPYRDRMSTSDKMEFCRLGAMVCHVLLTEAARFPKLPPRSWRLSAAFARNTPSMDLCFDGFDRLTAGKLNTSLERPSRGVVSKSFYKSYCDERVGFLPISSTI